MLIGEVARRCGIAASALRYYERRGLLAAPARSEKWRIYDAQVIGRLRIILLARDAGFSIAETRAFISGHDGNSAPSARWHAMADRETRELHALIDRAS